MNNIKLRKINDKNEIQVSYLPTRASISRGQQMRRKLLFTYYKFRCLWVDVASAKATQLTETSANLGNPFSWYSDNENILVRMLPKNRAALLEKKSTNRSHCFKCNRHNFSKQDLSRFIEK
jgi:hypothetical protein